VHQPGEGLALAGAHRRDRVVTPVWVADGDGPDRHPLVRHPVLRAEPRQVARIEAEELGAEALVSHGEQDEQRGETGVDIPPRDEPL